MNHNFKKFMNFFMTTDLWKAMEQTSENSPWHREANVALHTQMVLNHYWENIADFRTPREQVLTMLSLAFHDTGKPAAKRWKFTEERQDYLSFRGHEKISARLFEGFAAKYWDLLVLHFDLKIEDIYIITWVIENHLSHIYETPEQKQRLRNHLSSVEFNGYENVFFDHLIADQSGRQSDNYDYNLNEVVKVVSEIRALAPTRSSVDMLDKNVFIMIGASGSGKSSATKTLSAFYDLTQLSLDAMRLEVGKEAGINEVDEVVQYRECFKYCDENKDIFNAHVKKVTDEVFKTAECIIIDNTNTSEKSRADFIKRARENGFSVTAVLLPIHPEALKARAALRGDKSVPVDAIMRQYNGITMPWANVEDGVDRVIVTPGNLNRVF